MTTEILGQTRNMSAIQSIVIVGRDMACWLAANSLKLALGFSGVKITVIELPSLVNNCETLSSLPALESLHRILGFEEYELLKLTAGTYGLGHSFANFSKSNVPFFHPYATHGASINKLDFLQYWIKARRSGLQLDFESFSLNTIAAKNERFFLPTTELYSFAKSNYGYNMQAQAYIRYIREMALRRGVELISSHNVAGKLDKEQGHIDSVFLSNGQEIKADLFIDATGAEGVLIKETLKTDFKSWKDYFPQDRILLTCGEKLKTLPPYGQTRALNDSVLQLVPLQNMTGLIHSYDSELMDDQSALETAAIVSNLRIHPNAQTVVTPFSAGHVSQIWVKNCIAIGESAASLHPIDNVALQTIHLGLVHLINLFPLGRDMALEARAYNEVMISSIERLRDFQLSHFKLNQYFDSPFWDYMRQIKVPDELAHKIDLFKARGNIALYDNETFENDDWKAIFICHGLMPETYDPLVDQTSDQEAIRQFQAMMTYIKDQVKDMVSHDAFLEVYTQ